MRNTEDDQTETKETATKQAHGFAALLADKRKRVELIAAAVAVVLAAALTIAGVSGAFNKQSQSPAVRPVPSEMANGNSSSDSKSGSSTKGTGESAKSGNTSDSKADDPFSKVGDEAPSAPTTDGSTVDFSTGKPVTSDKSGDKSGSESDGQSSSTDSGSTLSPAVPLH
ncbi:hypothetical protein [Bifidobacterium leontopitheci]|uniref:Uncharacterized protein n=1 Tax=Bifidobacterium leontopitheci TaxID=2650774 RepID=A0A6I1GQK3_9BIFI|nr:hypothetical protein [Bifidobacterium leontopitheci]KAB7790378.1 hypothetical protein F7D09_1064 [Bifidobacterium leontopitheci]